MTSRFKDLKWWQKLSVFGAIASILGCLIIFREYLWLALKWVWLGIDTVWNHLSSDSGVPFWLLYAMLLAILFLTKKVLVNWSKGASLASDSLKPYHYRKDVFYDVVWRWQYPSEHYLQPDNFTPFCPTCDMELVRQREGRPVVHYCDKCKTEFSVSSESVYSMRDYMTREIQRRIRSGEWRDRILKSTQPNSKAD